MYAQGSTPCLLCPQVQQTGAHVAVRSWGSGKDMSVYELRHAHFRGLQVEGRACKGQSGLARRRQKAPGAKLEGLYEWQNPSYNATGTLATEKFAAIAAIAKQARQCALMDFMDEVSFAHEVHGPWTPRLRSSRWHCTAGLTLPGLARAAVSSLQ